MYCRGDACFGAGFVGIWRSVLCLTLFVRVCGMYCRGDAWFGTGLLGVKS